MTSDMKDSKAFYGLICSHEGGCMGNHTQTKPLGEVELRQAITDICFENGGVTKPMVDKLTDLILQERKAWGERVIAVEDDIAREISPKPH